MPKIDMNIDEDWSLPVFEMHPDALLIRIRVDSCSEPVEATVLPQGLLSFEPDLAGVVQWNGIEEVVSVVKTLAPLDPWRRRIQLVAAVLDEKSLPTDFRLNVGNWFSADLSMSAPSGCDRNRVHVSLDRRNWRASVSGSGAPDGDFSIDIPPQSRGLDIGSMIVEMTSRLIFQQ